jgi:hypothetical protein
MNYVRKHVIADYQRTHNCDYATAKAAITEAHLHQRVMINFLEAA